MAIFSKLLSKNDIKKRLSVPRKHLNSLVPSFVDEHAVDFEAVDERGCVWIFRCSICKKKYPKPVLTKGWLAYVRNKKLNVGDKIKFYKEKNHTARAPFRVQAEREIKISGAIFGYAPIL